MGREFEIGHLQFSPHDYRLRSLAIMHLVESVGSGKICVFVCATGQLRLRQRLAVNQIFIKFLDSGARLTD